MEYNDLKFYIYPGYDHVFRHILYDLKEENNCTVVENIFSETFIEVIWNTIVKHPKFNLLFGNMIATLLKGYINIPEITDKTVFLFSNIGIQYIPNCLLKMIQKKNAKIILYFLDDLANINSKIAYKKANKIDFDLVCSFDKKNSYEHGFTYMDSMISLMPITKKRKIGDLIFIGSDKERRHIIKEIIIEANKHNIKNMFSIYQTPAEFWKDLPEVKINESIDYNMVVKMENEVNCILDIVMGEQSGLSLRVYEAVIYNKKLLTNNKSVLDFAYYDPRYIQYFESVSDIDWEFVKEDIDVEFNYRGDFSPVAFLHKVCELL